MDAQKHGGTIYLLPHLHGNLSKSQQELLTSIGLGSIPSKSPSPQQFLALSGHTLTGASSSDPAQMTR